MITDAADRSTPTDIREELGRYGGLNPYGRAHWRVVLAQERLCRRGGVFKTMPTGDVAVIEVDPKTFEVHRREVKPERVVTGIRDVPKYPVRGWILERWFPASHYNKQEWERAKSSDGVTPMMGPFPHEGEYFMLGGPWAKVPEMADMKMAIAMHLREEATRPRNYAEVLRQEIEADRLEEERTMAKAYDDLAHFYDSEVEPVLKGTSLGAQRIRNEMQDAMGERSHQGVA